MADAKKLACPCCGCLTLDERGAYDICPVCFWEDDAYLVFSENGFAGARLKGVEDEQLLDVPSGANHGLTLREGRRNYNEFGACEREMTQYVRKPKKEELP